MTDAAKGKRPGRKKGAPKTGGRKKGTRNRNSMTVLRALDQANIPLVEFLITDIQTLEPAERVNRYFQLMGYVYPKLKETDATPANSSPPATGPAPTAPTPASREDRMKLIHGQNSGKPEASG